MENDREQDPTNEVDELETSESEISDTDSNAAADPGGDVIIIK